MSLAGCSPFSSFYSIRPPFVHAVPPSTYLLAPCSPYSVRRYTERRHPLNSTALDRCLAFISFCTAELDREKDCLFDTLLPATFFSILSSEKRIAPFAASLPVTRLTQARHRPATARETPRLGHLRFILDIRSLLPLKPVSLPRRPEIFRNVIVESSGMCRPDAFTADCACLGYVNPTFPVHLFSALLPLTFWSHFSGLRVRVLCQQHQRRNARRLH